MANEKRVRVNNCFGIVGASLSAGGTVLTFATVPNIPTIDTTKHIALVLDPDSSSEEIVYVTAYAAGALTATIVRAQEGTAATSHGAGAAWIHGPTKRDHAAGRAAFAGRTAGNITLNSTVWASLDGAGGLDVAVPAFAGDLIEVGMSGIYGSEAVEACMDIVSWVAGGPISYWGAAGAAGDFGIGAWYAPVATTNQSAAGSAMKLAVVSDIAGGLLTLRPRYRTITAANKTLYANANVPLQFWAKNHGPQEAA